MKFLNFIAGIALLALFIKVYKSSLFSSFLNRDVDERMFPIILAMVLITFIAIVKIMFSSRNRLPGKFPRDNKPRPEESKFRNYPERNPNPGEKEE